MRQISKIFHIADIHCRTYQRHNEFRQVFDKVFQYIEENKDENSIIVLAGDIIHSKLDISAELVDLVSYLFKRCSDLCITIGIPGNHDLNLNNKSRLDPLTPICNALNLKNFYYWKDSGVYKIPEFPDVDFAVMGILQDKSEWPKSSDCSSKTKLALFHGAVDGCLLENNMLYPAKVKVSDFEGFDLVMLGDIHRMQILSQNPIVAYPGSLVQQNFGESLDHGFIVWDFENNLPKSHRYVPIQNDWGYITLEVKNGKLLTDISNLENFKNLRVRFKFEKTNISEINSIITKLSKKFNISELIYHKINSIPTGIENTSVSNFMGNIRDVENQNKLISEYLLSKGVPKSEIGKVIEINSRNPAQNAPISVRHQVWKPRRFEFSNMFSYGENNVIDFTDFKGVYGLFAPNASGKSALLDSFVYCLYDKSSRTFKAKNILNNKKENFYCKLSFELAGLNYYVERIGSLNKKKDNVKVDVNFWYENEKGEIVSLNGKDRDETNKNIREYIGGYDDFILTTLSTQNDNQSFINKTQKERKDLLYKFLDLSIFEDLYRYSKDEYKELQIIHKELKKIDLVNEISNTEKQISEKKSELSRIEKENKVDVIANKDLSKKIIDLSKKLNKVSENIDIEEVNRKVEELQSLDQRFQDLVFSKKKDLEDVLEKKKSLELEISGMDPDKLNKSAEDFSVLSNEINSLRISHSRIVSEIESCREKSDHLDNHEYDPNCEFCVKNPFVVDAKLSRDKISDLIPVEEEISRKISDYEKSISRLEEDKKVLSRYYFLQKEILSVSKNISDKEQEIASITDKKSKIESEIKSLGELVEKYESNKRDIEENKKILQEISTLEKDQKEIENRININSNSISDLKASIQVYNHRIENLKIDHNRVKEIEEKFKYYEYYIDSVSKNGVAYELLKKSIPVIENEVNEILSQVVDFKIKLETSEDNTINGYIFYDEERTWPVELTSGMERFILSIALRVAMTEITSLSRSNFIALDEGFGVLDSDKISSINLLFEYLKSQFQFVLCISHIDVMKDLADNLIHVEKSNSFSRVFID